MSCYRKDKYWAGCKERCSPGEDPKDPPADRTPWSCELLRPEHEGGAAEERTSAAEEAAAEALPPPPAWPSPLASFAPACNVGITKGSLTVGGVGVATYAAGNNGRVQDPELLLAHNSGFSILRACAAQYSPESFAVFRLLSGKVTFTVDLSRVGCACNLAFYLTAQPAKGADGFFNPGEKGDYYCDANDVQSQWCPEIDIMEANNHVFAATPHTCEEPTPLGHYTQCDRHGIGQNTRTMRGAYGLGPQNRINTEKPFTVSTEFMSAFNGAKLSGIRTTLTQEGKTVVLDHGNIGAAYLERLGRSLSEGMAIRISYWGNKPQRMAWLDEPPCSAKAVCAGSSAGYAVISGIAVQGTLAPPVYQQLRPMQMPAPVLPQPMPGQIGGPGSLPFANNGAPGMPTYPDYEEVSPFSPTESPSAYRFAGGAQGAQDSRRYRFRPKVALAALVAAVSGAGLVLALCPPCQRDPNSISVALQSMPTAGGLCATSYTAQHPCYVAGALSPPGLGAAHRGATPAPRGATPRASADYRYHSPQSY